MEFSFGSIDGGTDVFVYRPSHAVPLSLSLSLACFLTSISSTIASPAFFVLIGCRGSIGIFLTDSPHRLCRIIPPALLALFVLDHRFLPAYLLQLVSFRHYLLQSAL
jgi:hypothetical protein